MAEANNHEMKLGLGYSVDLTGLQDIVQITNQINEATKAAATGLKGIESVVNNTSKSNNQWLTRQKQLRDADLLSYEDYKKQLEQKNKELYSDLEKIRKQYGDSSKEYDSALSKYSAVHKEMTNITKQEARKQAEITKQNLKEITSQYNQSISNFKSLGKEINRTFGATRSLGESILNSMITYGALRQITSEFQNLGNVISDINYNVINNQRLMGDFSDELRDSLNSSAAEIAKNTGIAITDAQQIQGAWIRINEDYAKSAELLDEISHLTAEFMNVGEIEDAEHAVTLLNASLLQFNVSTHEAIEMSKEFANKWAYMADITAMGTADEYGEAISKFGANVQALNGDMDDAIALSSIMADRLAKSGTEAGTALKTFTAYMNRGKTRSLFATIAQDLGDTSFNLIDANGRLLDFNDNLRKIAEAYNIYKSQGNDAMSQAILESIGATRQRDTAMAIMNAVNDGSYDEYLDKLQNDEVGGYIEEQNAALMETLANQYNAMVVALQSAASNMANSGIIQVVTLLMNGFEGFLDVVGSIPTPVMTMVNAFLALKTGIAGLDKIGEITGMTDRLWQSLRIGTKDQIENAKATQSVVTSMLDREKASLAVQKSALGETAAYKQQSKELVNFSSGCEQAAIAYKNGSMNAEEYSNTLKTLQKNYIDNTNAIKAKVIGEQEKAAAEKLSAATTTNAAAADKARNITRKEGLVQLAKEKAAIIAKNGQEKVGIVTTKAANVVESIRNTIKEKGILGTIKYVAAEGMSTAAKLAGTAATWAFNAATTALGVALNLVLNPMFLITAGITALSYLFGSSGDKAEKLQSDIDDLNSTLSETKSRIQELEDIDRKSGLTKAEREELEYLEQKNKLLEDSIKLKQQEKNNTEWEDNGGFLGFGTSEGSKEALQDLIDEYENAEYKVNNYTKALKDLDEESAEAELFSEELADANKELRTTAADLVQEYYRLKENYDNGFYSGDAAVGVREYLDELEGMLPELSAITKQYQNLSDTVKTLSDETEEYAEDINGLNSSIEDLNDLFDEYNKEGYLSYETVSKLVAEHPEYVKYLVKVGDQYKLNKLAEEELNAANKSLIETTDELIAKLGEEGVIGQELSQDMIDAVDAVDNFTIGIKDTFGNVEGIDKFVEDLRAINVSLLKGESSIEQYNTSMNDLINSLDFSKVNDDLSKMDEETKQVAQSQQAMLTSLAQEVSNYMMEITNALFTGQMSATEYVNALQGSNENILDMYVASNDLVQNQAGQWVDAAGAVDTYANSLQNAINGLNGMSAATQFLEEHQTILSELQANTANNMVDATWWAANQQSEAYQAMATDFSGLMGNLYTNNRSAWESIVKDVLESTNYQTTNIVNSNGTITEAAQGNAAIMGAFTEATMNQVGDSVNTAASAAGNVLSSLGEMIKNFSYTIKFTPQADLKFDPSKILEGKSPFSGSGLKLKITGEGGSSVSDFANSLSTFGNSLKSVDFSSYFNNIGSYTPRSYQSVGGTGLTGGGYSPTNYNGSSRNTPATRTPTGKSDAEKAAEKAAKAAEEATKAIEKITKEYVKNVESMYDRIAKALKKKYQEQYDERKKLLEKEHNERVAQIQAEIDKIQGNTTEDKQARLDNLYEKYEQWSQDDSTLGKQKQKEYLDQIKELEDEIRIDELEKQIDEENERYEQSIDSDSEFYDKTLRKLDTLMSDEHVYKEAKYLIENGKEKEIVDLLSDYDAKWDGWATLMGKSAGEVIADEVALALANYKDVKNGTITENGGTNTNKLTGGGTSGSSSGGTSSGGGTTTKTIGKGSKVKINNTSAGMYVASDSKSKVGTWKGYSGNYFIVNDKNGRAALAKTNNINGAIGWIDKKYLVGLATGGYTGDSEGLAMLHKKERVLNAQQTSAFEHLVYDFLPRVSKELLNPLGNTYNNNGNITFNKELVKVDIGTVVNNKQFDMDNGIDNLDRAFRKSLKKSGINLKK